MYYRQFHSKDLICNRTFLQLLCTHCFNLLCIIAEAIRVYVRSRSVDKDAYYRAIMKQFAYMCGAEDSEGSDAFCKKGSNSRICAEQKSPCAMPVLVFHRSNSRICAEQKHPNLFLDHKCCRSNSRICAEQKALYRAGMEKICRSNSRICAEQKVRASFRERLFPEAIRVYVRSRSSRSLQVPLRKPEAIRVYVRSRRS